MNNISSDIVNVHLISTNSNYLQEKFLLSFREHFNSKYYYGLGFGICYKRI